MVDRQPQIDFGATTYIQQTALGKKNEGTIIMLQSNPVHLAPVAREPGVRHF